MSDDILLEQDGRILRATFNTAPDNGVSDSMAGAFSEAILNAHETSDMVLLRSASEFARQFFEFLGGAEASAIFIRNGYGISSH